MDCAIFYHGNEVGRLQMEREGLYYRFKGKCNVTSSRILRLYASDEARSIPIGVLMPKDGAFVIDEKISVRRWEMSEMDCAVCGYALSNGALPWRGTVADVMVDGWRKDDVLFLPDDEAFPLPENWQDAEFLTIDSKKLARLDITAKG